METIRKITAGAHDAANESALLETLSDERKERYLKYKTMTISVLKEGKGLNELCALTEYGYHERAITCKNKILDILLMVLSSEEKSVMIASELMKI